MLMKGTTRAPVCRRHRIHWHVRRCFGGKHVGGEGRRGVLLVAR
jgi:hypothetical protein